jgi:hypothetical protein
VGTRDAVPAHVEEVRQRVGRFGDIIYDEETNCSNKITYKQMLINISTMHLTPDTRFIAADE